MTLSCDAAMSDDVLQASRAAIAKHLTYAERCWAPERWINDLPEKQRPLVPLLMSLIDAAEAVARAVNDNAWDDLAPLERSLIKTLTDQLRTIESVIEGANDPPAAHDYSLPSMTGKELV